MPIDDFPELDYHNDGLDEEDYYYTNDNFLEAFIMYNNCDEKTKKQMFSYIKYNNEDDDASIMAHVLYKTPLSIACVNGYCEVAKLLIEHGANYYKYIDSYEITHGSLVRRMTPYIYDAINKKRDNIIALLIDNLTTDQLVDKREQRHNRYAYEIERYCKITKNEELAQKLCKKIEK